MLLNISHMHALFVSGKIQNLKYSKTKPICYLYRIQFSLDKISGFIQPIRHFCLSLLKMIN